MTVTVLGSELLVVADGDNWQAGMAALVPQAETGLPSVPVVAAGGMGDSAISLVSIT